MIDEIYDRQYQAGRAELHGGIDRLLRRVGRALSQTFQAIRRVQYDAPWTGSKRRGMA